MFISIKQIEIINLRESKGLHLRVNAVKKTNSGT